MRPSNARPLLGFCRIGEFERVADAVVAFFVERGLGEIVAAQ